MAGEDIDVSAEGLAQYSYRELQRLCKDLNVPSAGKRAELEERLRQLMQEDAAVDEDEDSEVNDDDDDDDEEEEESGSDDDEEEDDEEGDDDGEPSAEPEILGMLVRAPEGSGAEEGEDVYFISADDFEKEWNAANREVYGPRDGDSDDDESDGDDDVLEYGDNADADDEEDDVLFGVSTTRWDNVARNVSNALATFEFFVFVVLLCGVLQEAQKVGTSGGAHAVNPSKVYDEPRTVAEAIYLALSTHALTAAFWSTLAYYSTIFYAVPTVVGLVFGNYTSPESVFVFATARYALYYLLAGYSAVFTWEAFPFQERVFTVTCAVSFLMAFWEKQSTIFL